MELPEVVKKLIDARTAWLHDFISERVAEHGRKLGEDAQVRVATEELDKLLKFKVDHFTSYGW